MKQAIKMVAIDLDGTLLQDDLQISLRDREAIAEARRLGVKVVIATGRMYSTTVKYARSLELDTPLICFNGAYITDIDNKNKLEHYRFSMEYARYIHQEVMLRKMHANYYLEDDIHVAELNDLVRGYQKRLEIPIQVVEDMEAFFSMYSLLTKITIQSDSQEQIADLNRWIEASWPHKLYVIRSNPHFLEVSHPVATKGTGVARIAKEYQLQAHQVMTIGDQQNDIPMIEYAGIGVAMDNGDALLKMKADYITSSNGNDGVGRAIEKFVLGV